MDAFVRAGATVIGPGGLRCNCCNSYRRFGSRSKKLPGFSKLRRTRLRAGLNEEVEEARVLFEETHNHCW